MVCREEGDREELIRLVASPEGEIVLDFRARLPGRGAWIHPSRACLDLLRRRKGVLKRALGAEGDVGALEAQLRDRVREAMLDGLSMAAAAGALVGGRDVLERALVEERVAEVIVASDASPRTVEALRRAAGDAVPFTVVDVDRETLGARIGKGARAAVGVLASSASVHLRRQLRRLRMLG